MNQVQRVHQTYKVPQRNNWWTHEQLKLAIKMTKEKVPIDQIAKEVGRSIESCTRKLQKQGYSVVR